MVKRILVKTNQFPSDQCERGDCVLCVKEVGKVMYPTAGSTILDMRVNMLDVQNWKCMLGRAAEQHTQA